MIRYEVIKDSRNDKVYLDHAGSIIRNFETVLKGYHSKQLATTMFPNAIDITNEA